MIFFYSNQTGTTLYFKSLIKKKKDCFLFIKKNKFNLFKNELNNKSIKNFSELYLFYKKINPKIFFISATRDKIEDKIIRLSKKLNFKVVSVIDYPTNLNIKKRFVGKTLNLLPDKIFVPDQFTLKKMVQIGYPLKKILVVGNPYLAEIKKIKKNNSKNKVLLLDQNFPNHDYLKHLKKLKKNLEDLHENFDFNIRRHPDNLKTLNEKKIFIKQLYKDNCKFLDSYSHVIGHSSTMMSIALLKGLNVLSYNPFLKKDFNCPLFERGLIDEGKKIKDIINFLILKKKTKKKRILNSNINKKIFFI